MSQWKSRLGNHYVSEPVYLKGAPQEETNGEIPGGSTRGQVKSSHIYLGMPYHSITSVVHQQTPWGPTFRDFLEKVTLFDISGFNAGHQWLKSVFSPFSLPGSREVELKAQLFGQHWFLWWPTLHSWSYSAPTLILPTVISLAWKQQ